MRAFPFLPTAFLMTFLVAACGGPDFVAGGRKLPIPEDPGLYALTRAGDLRRLDGNPEWERKTWQTRSDLEPEVELMVFEPGLGRRSGPDDVPARLWRIAWLRSDIQPTGAAAPRSGSEWVRASLESQAVPVAATWHPEIAGLVHLAPAGVLEPGLYEIALTRGTGAQARLGVLWSSTDKRDYAAANCVDRIVGEPLRFEPCTSAARAASPQMLQQASAFAPAGAAAAPPLGIQLATPEQENGGLRIRGSIVNGSASPQRIPMLQGTIFDGTGAPADRWFFAASEPSVGPGGEVGFTTWRSKPEGASRLDVDFVQP